MSKIIMLKKNPKEFMSYIFNNLSPLTVPDTVAKAVVDNAEPQKSVFGPLEPITVSIEIQDSLVQLVS